MAPKIHGVMPPSRNHRKIVSPPELFMVFIVLYPLAIQIRTTYFSLCKYFFLEQLVLCTDSCSITHAVPSYLMKCRNCGHGTDLRGCPQWPFRTEGNLTKKKQTFHEALLQLQYNTDLDHQDNNTIIYFLSVYYSVVVIQCVSVGRVVYMSFTLNLLIKFFKKKPS